MNWDLQKIYYYYLMGAYNSIYELEDWNTPRIGYCANKNCSYWEFQDKPKNFDYFFTKNRFTYISREHYKNDYIKGYIWGRYKIKNSLDTINETREGENGYDSGEYEEEQERSF